MVSTIELQPNDVPLLPARILPVGKLKCLYEKGNLRYISSGGEELVRMIYTAVRNSNWNTADYEVTNEQVKILETGFSITYTAVYKLGQIHYKAFIQIEGKEDTITYRMQGEALSRFETNRVGICVLHPLSTCAGRKVTVTQADGSEYESNFPEAVSPHQPFKNVQQMQWLTANGNLVHLQFAGDVFETEDQRNWSDGSYKTYSRPLELPFPYWVEEGEQMEQTVTFTLAGFGKESTHADPKLQAVTRERISFPLIGYCRAWNAEPMTATRIGMLSKIPFHHYRVVLHLFKAGWQSILKQALLEAKQLQTKLELVIVFSDRIEPELESCINTLSTNPELVYSILVLQNYHTVTPVGLLNEVYDSFKASLPGVAVGYGTNGNFSDVNRNRPLDVSYDFVSFPLNPQVHASDIRSIKDNLDSHISIIQTAQAFSHGKNIHISPLMLNSIADEEIADVLQEHNSDTGPRQQTAFAASWMLQAIKNLGCAGVLTLGDTTGRGGIIKREMDVSIDERATEQILSTPLYNALVAIKNFEPQWIVINDEEESDDCLVLENNSGERLMFIAEEMPGGLKE